MEQPSAIDDEPLAIQPSAMTRRCFLHAALLAPAAFRQRGATFVSAVPLGDPGGRRPPPFGQLLGAGLDARLFTDLSVLSPDKPDTLLTPTERFYVRTAATSDLAQPAATEADRAALAKLDRTSGRVRVGPYVMECAGNSDPTNFGLMSAATWSGLPMPLVLERLGINPAMPRILVEGLDSPGPARTSVPGASWIFTRAELERAILADEINAASLPRDHGGPTTRLVVPGWYGCACIKWVSRITGVSDTAPATVQMREFAARTHQSFDSSQIDSGLKDGKPLLARDFEPAIIDTAAMPVRVEKWAESGRVFYRIVGIMWGGSKPTNALSIRFRSGDIWTRVDECPLPASTLTWSLWSHTWRPEEPGRYQIVLRVDDPAIRTRRLDLFFYVRDVTIAEV
jgi:DMSO/TMAO reductase YedYZ molybdopterin-dependent catalytic subunit